jgi:hypothetical protein
MSSEYTIFTGRPVVEIYEKNEKFMIANYWVDLVDDLSPEQLENIGFNILQVVSYWRPDSDAAKALELVGRMDGGPRLC